MIVENKIFKDACSKILYAIDKEGTMSGISDLLSLEAKGDTLFLGVTNREYFVYIKFPLEREETFKATIQADKFLKLIPQLTTENIELNIQENFVSIKSNGEYKIPLIFNETKMVELKDIIIDNPITTMMVDNEILKSILQYNSKELMTGIMENPVLQKLHYLDDQGCITYTSTGACVNSFILPNHIQVLINNKIVKLFKLFEEKEIKLTLGYDKLSESIIQTKLMLETDRVKLTAILNCDDSLVKKFPASLIRDKVEEPYPYSIVVNKNSLISSLNRLLLFTSNKLNSMYKAIGKFTFTPGKITISDMEGENTESLNCDGFESGEYSCPLDIKDLKLTLDSCEEQFLTFSFGNNLSVLISRLNITNIIQECDLSNA